MNTAARKESETPAQAIAHLTGDPNFMTSLARGLAVVSAFSKQRKLQTIADLARHTGLSRAAVRRCLYTLQALGYVQRHNHLFQLCPKVLTLGYAYLTSTQLAVTAQPFLERVSDRVNESCSMSVLEKNEILYVGRSNTRRIMSIALVVGSRLPAYCTSMGRVLLAAQSIEAQADYFAKVHRLPFTEYTVYKLSDLKTLLQGIHSQGYAIVNQELEIGLCSVAVPICNVLGDTVAAMNVSFQSSQSNMDKIEGVFLPNLQAAAQELSVLLAN